MGARGGKHLLIGIWLADQRRGRQPRKGDTREAAKRRQWKRYPQATTCSQGRRAVEGEVPWIQQRERGAVMGASGGQDPLIRI